MIMRLVTLMLTGKINVTYESCFVKLMKIRDLDTIAIMIVESAHPEDYVRLPPSIAPQEIPKEERQYTGKD